MAAINILRDQHDPDHWEVWLDVETAAHYSGLCLASHGSRDAACEEAIVELLTAIERIRTERTKHERD